MAQSKRARFLLLQQLLLDQFECDARLEKENDEPIIVYHDRTLGRLCIRLDEHKSWTVSIGRDGERLRCSANPLPVYEGEHVREHAFVSGLHFRYARVRDVADKTDTYTRRLYAIKYAYNGADA